MEREEIATPGGAAQMDFAGGLTTKDTKHPKGMPNPIGGAFRVFRVFRGDPNLHRCQRPFIAGNSGNAPCGSFWYQKAVDATSSVSGW